MIDDELQEKLVERLINRIEQLNEEIIKEIGRQLKRIGALSPKKAWQLQQILKYGSNLDKMIRELSNITNLNTQDIYAIFEEEAKANQEFAKQFYQARGIEYIPYAQNEILKRQVRAIANITASQYVNLSKTMAFASLDADGNIIYNDLATTYQNIIDKSILSLTQGKETYQQSINRAMKTLTSEGITVVDYKSGYKRRLDSAVRMNVLDGMRNMSNELQQQFGKEYGADGVEVSVHMNSAPDHIDVQGHQFSLEEFKSFQNGNIATDYKGRKYMPYKDGKDRRPISTMNCYHRVFNIVLGISKPIYSQEQLDAINEANLKGFEFEGKHYTNYEGTQLQRKIETEVRRQQEIQMGAVAIDDKDTIGKTQKRITHLTQKYRELSRASGLPTKIDRMKVKGYKKQKAG